MTEAVAELKLLSAMSKASSGEGTYSVASPPESYFYAELAEAYRYLRNYD